jgi:23S rRNA (uracil1939-C5)-methyltransferase
LDIAVEDAKPLDAETQQELSAFVARVGVARISWNGDLALQQTAPFQTVDGLRVTPPPGAFLQATKHGETTLIEAVRGAIGPAQSVLDLFAGCGTFSLPLSRQASVHAAESTRAMMDALDAAWRAGTGIKQITTETRDLFREPVITSDINRFEAVVIDPPRAGAQAQSQELANSNVPRIAAVSCNPATFVRDAKILISGGYRLDWVQVVDQFRWSSHVELAAQFTKGHITGE